MMNRTDRDLETLAEDLEDDAARWRGRGHEDLAGMLDQTAVFAREQIGTRRSVYESHYAEVDR